VELREEGKDGSGGCSWKRGIKHLEEEMLVAELMTDGLEDVDDAHS
jgi:hypothetical protein